MKCEAGKGGLQEVWHLGFKREAGEGKAEGRDATHRIGKCPSVCTELRWHLHTSALGLNFTHPSSAS